MAIDDEADADEEPLEKAVKKHKRKVFISFFLSFGTSSLTLSFMTAKDSAG